MNKENKRTVEIDIKKIFLTPPDTNKERIIFLSMLVITFVIFFGPLCFSAIPPIKGILLSCLPALSLSWGWIVFLRSLFSKEKYCL